MSLLGLAPVVLDGGPKLGLILKLLGWFKMLNAGKFCHANRVLLAGQLEMYGAKRVQAQDCRSQYNACNKICWYMLT